MNRAFVNHKKQRGAALFVALIMLLALTIIGLSGSQRSSTQSVMATNVHSKNVAFNSAESAISAFAIEASADDAWSDANNTLRKLFNSSSGKIGPICYDRQGNKGSCDGSLWMDKAGYAESRISGEIITRCAKNCPGYSKEAGACVIMRMTATGTVGGKFGDPGTQSETSIVDFFKIAGTGDCG